jgi:hypothetical protein
MLTVQHHQACFFHTPPGRSGCLALTIILPSLSSLTTSRCRPRSIMAGAPADAYIATGAVIVVYDCNPQGSMDLGGRIMEIVRQ